MSRGLILFLISVSLTVPCTFAQTCADLTTLIDKNYGFKPSKLTSAQIDAKSAELDKVWSMVDKAPITLLPCLRNEIAKRRTDTFFRFDASNLLIKHDKSPETKKLLIDTYSKVDLADVARRYWLPPMTALAREGHDISTAAEVWLRYANPDYYVPGHGTRLVTKDLGAIALFGSMDESLATPALVRLATDKNADFRQIVFYLLIRQATVDSEAAARKLISLAPAEYAERIRKDLSNQTLVEPRVGQPKMTRDAYLKALNDLLAGKPAAWTRHTMEVKDGEKDMVAVLTSADIPLVRKVRRYYAATPTELSAEWYELFTQIINTLRKKGSSKSRVGSI